MYLIVELLSHNQYYLQYSNERTEIRRHWVVCCHSASGIRCWKWITGSMSSQFWSLLNKYLLSKRWKRWWESRELPETSPELYVCFYYCVSPSCSATSIWALVLFSYIVSQRESLTVDLSLYPTVPDMTVLNTCLWSEVSGLDSGKSEWRVLWRWRRDWVKYFPLSVEPTSCPVSPMSPGNIPMEYRQLSTNALKAHQFLHKFLSGSCGSIRATQN